MYIYSNNFSFILTQTIFLSYLPSITELLREKEEEMDYRYMPEPDLPPLTVPAEQEAAVRAQLPELPRAAALRLSETYGISPAEAWTLVAAPGV